MLRKALVAAAILAVCPFCAPKPPQATPDPKPAPTADVRPACATACANLQTIGCPLGGDRCPGVCAKASRLRQLPLACWSNARTKQEARDCEQGSLTCE